MAYNIMLPLDETPMLKTTEKYYRIDRREVYFLRFILEAYDGIAVLTTLDPEAGIIMISIPPGCEDEVEMVLQELKKDMMIEYIDAPNPVMRSKL